MIKATVYQLKDEFEESDIAFASLDAYKKASGSDRIKSENYLEVYDGNFDAENLEDIFRILNTSKPEGYLGRSLTVSDIVSVNDSNTVPPGSYYCDIVGFKKVEFDRELAGVKRLDTIEVIYVEPGKEAVVKKIGTGLADLQKAVDGYIETYYPFRDDVCIVCNDCGKFNGMEPNRAVYDDEGRMMDIVFGPFIIADSSGERFRSVGGSLKEKYLEMFRLPERFYSIDGEIRGEKFDPSEKDVFSGREDVE